MVVRLRIDGATFRDEKNREVILHGINAGADAKNPSRPDIPSHQPDGFFDGDNMSFVGRPFEVDDAAAHFSRLRRWGYNSIRYIFTWEALEAAGPGRYDEDFIQHTIKVLRVAKDFGFYVYMDPHQDVWSRFTGGSGAPMWTIYACGLDPRKFHVTQAALVQNTWPDPDAFPKMVWATSYTRLACQVIFTMFFAGRAFAPRCVIDGVNIQDYLQGHFVAACKHLATRIREAGDLEGAVVVGWESLNEPNHGLVGLPDLTRVPASQQLKLGTSPTAWDAILLGSGVPCELETWAFGSMGPYKSGKELVDPKGETAWLSPEGRGAGGYDDARYGWRRDPGWRLGECVWAQHGVWDPVRQEVLKKDYFARDPETGEEISYEYFTNKWWLGLYRRYRDAVRDVFPHTIMFAQPPTLELPPSLRGTEDDDRNMVYAPHWYDGLTLMTKKWNKLWNVDVLGVLRGRYWTPALAVKIGESAIRNCFRSQLSAILQEGLDYMGEHPCVLTETGIPYDMDDSKAYATGDYSSQTAAMDAVHYALEGSKINFALWTYCATNTHRRGDQWNGEDLSVYSLDDPTLPASSASADFSTDPLSPSYSASNAAGTARGSLSSDLKRSMTVEPRAVDQQSRLSADLDGGKPKGSPRAASAYVRPYPAAVAGDIVSYGFDLRSCTFDLSLRAAQPASEDAPSEVFLPDYHFPRDVVDVEVSGGRWTIEERRQGDVQTQVLVWWHGEGEQRLRVRGSVRASDAFSIRGSEGILQQCRETICAPM